VKAGIQDTVVFAEAFDDKRTLLRHNNRGSRQHDQNNDRQNDGNDQSSTQIHGPSSVL
jgi:hypothetical protein